MSCYYVAIYYSCYLFRYELGMSCVYKLAERSEFLEGFVRSPFLFFK